MNIKCSIGIHKLTAITWSNPIIIYQCRSCGNYIYNNFKSIKKLQQLLNKHGCKYVDNAIVSNVNNKG